MVGLQASPLRADDLAVRTGGEPPYECKPLHVALQDDGTIAPTDDWSQIIIEQVRLSLTHHHGLTQGVLGCSRAHNSGSIAESLTDAEQAA